MKIQPAVLLLFAFAGLPLRATAAPVIHTDVTSLGAGSFHLSVFVSQLDVPPGLGGVDLTFRFDPARVAIMLDWPLSPDELSDVAFGPLRFNIEEYGPEFPGYWRVVVVSLMSPDELLAVQQPEMLLLRRTFSSRDGQALSRESFSGSGELTDAFGAPLNATFVPEPGTGILAALAAFCFVRKSRRHMAWA